MDGYDYLSNTNYHQTNLKWETKQEPQKKHIGFIYVESRGLVVDVSLNEPWWIHSQLDHSSKWQNSFQIMNSLNLQYSNKNFNWELEI